MNALERHFVFAGVIGVLLGMLFCNINIWLTGTTNTVTTVIIAVFIYACITSNSFYELEAYLKEKYKR